MKRNKNSKARKFIIAATAFVALAVPATANAAVNLETYSVDRWTDSSTNSFRTHTQVEFHADGTLTNCNASNVVNSAGGPLVPVQDYLYHILYGSQSVTLTFDSRTSVGNATVSCDVTTNVRHVSYVKRWKSYSIHRGGTNTSSRSHSSSCYINGYSSELHLDCWGGSYAQASYRFALPRDARNIHRGISTRAGCCNYSGYNRAYWSGNTAIVRSTGWHGIYVRGVTVSYQHRARVSVVTYNTVVDTGIGQF